MDAPRPWIGSNFGKQPFRPSILIVGDSHYGDAEDESYNSLTEDVIRSRQSDLSNSAFFSIVEQIIVGRALLVHEVSRFWDQVAFINYAPRLVTSGKSADGRHFTGAEVRFKALAEELEPSLVCFFSAGAWQRRPWGGPDWNTEVFGAEPVAISDSLTLYPFKGRKIVAARFNHPRALGAPMDVWHSWFRETVRIAEDVRGGRR